MLLKWFEGTNFFSVYYVDINNAGKIIIDICGVYICVSQEDCVELYIDSDKAGRWNDAVCGLKRGIVCQQERRKSRATSYHALLHLFHSHYV